MGRSLARATSLMAVLLLVSKGAGFLREVAVANAYGAGIVKDANTIAYILPALFLILLGGLNGPFHLSTMRSVTSLRTEGRDAEIPGVLLTIFLATAALTGLLALAAALLAPWIVRITGPGLSPEAMALAVTNLHIMAPLIMIGGLIGVLCGISNARDKFTNSSLTPMVSSLAVIGVVLVTSSPTAIAWGTLAGAVGQLLLQAVPVAQDWREITGGAPVRPVPLNHPAFLDMLRMLVPAGLSSSVGTLNVAIASAFCSGLPEGSISAFNYSNQLIQLPLGILLTALLVPMFPRLTEAATAGDRASLFGWLNRGVQSIALVILPVTGLAIVLGEAAVRLVFEHGQFDAQDTRQTATVLSIVALSMLAYGTRDLFTRVFYAQNKSRTPLLVTVVSIGTTLVFNAVLVRYQLAGLAWATTLVTVGNLLLLGYFLRRDLGTLGLGPSVGTIVKAFVAAGACAGLAYLAKGFVPFPGQLGALVQLLGGGVVGLGAYVILLLLLRVPALELLRRRRTTPVAVAE